MTIDVQKAWHQRLAKWEEGGGALATGDVAVMRRTGFPGRAGCRVTCFSRPTLPYQLSLPRPIRGQLLAPGCSAPTPFAPTNSSIQAARSSELPPPSTPVSLAIEPPDCLPENASQCALCGDCLFCMTDPAGMETSPGAFHTTRWSRVRQAQDDSEEGRRALSDLCEAYYEPVLVYLRFELRDADQARDVAHSFFTEMLLGRMIGGVDRERGRFRSYLLGALKHFLSNERAAGLRQKRGGGAEHVSLDDETAQTLADPGQCPPDAAFDRQWATTLLGHALDTLRQEYESCGKAEFFDRLKPWLTGDAEHGEQQALAATLGINLNTLKSDIHRLKQRFQTLVKAEVAGTVDEDSSIREELASLFAALRDS